MSRADLLVSAYATEPRRIQLEGRREAQWFERLSALPGAGGIEDYYGAAIPGGRPGYFGADAPSGRARLAQLLPAAWYVTITMLPWTLLQQRSHKGYGLASDDTEGRTLAIADMRRVLEEIDEINQLLGRAAVRAIQVPSAPRPTPGTTASSAALETSLRELAEWDWHSTEILVEHCDCMRPSGPVSKGFLGLDVEIEAVRRVAAESPGRFGQSLNWGRSAIEGQSTSTPVAHIQKLVAAGTYRGMVFSGTSAQGGQLGPAWADYHNPLIDDDPSSLMTQACVRDTLEVSGRQALDTLAFIGVKVQDPRDADDFDLRLAPVERLLRVIEACL